MIRMFLSNIFYTEIVDDEGEGYRSGRMSPQPWRVYTFIKSMRRQSFSKEFILPKCPLVGVPTSCTLFPKIQSHPLRECPNYIVFWFILGIMQVVFSCTHNSLKLPSDRISLGPSTCILPLLC